MVIITNWTWIPVQRTRRKSALCSATVAIAKCCMAARPSDWCGHLPCTHGAALSTPLLPIGRYGVRQNHACCPPPDPLVGFAPGLWIARQLTWADRVLLVANGDSQPQLDLTPAWRPRDAVSRW